MVRTYTSEKSNGEAMGSYMVHPVLQDKVPVIAKSIASIYPAFL